MTSIEPEPPARARPGVPPGKLDFAVGAVLLIVTAAAYWPVRHAGFINFDDPDYVTANRIVKQGLTWEGLVWAFTTGHIANWHPVTWLSHMLDCSLFGLDPTGPHLVNVGLHALNALLLYWLFRRMTGSRFESAWVAGLFALHPAHVESVAWISERKDVLSTLFWLLTVLAWAGWVEAPRRGRYIAVLVFLALGLMCKPMLVTLPFVLLLFDYWPLARVGPDAPSERRITLKQAVIEKIPLFAVVAASTFVTFVAQQQGGAVASLQRVSLPYRLANALVSYARYLGELVWPTGLGVYYPLVTAWPAAWIAGAVALLAGITAVAWFARRRAPYLLVGWLFFLGTLVPVIGFVQVGSQSIADRYTYVPAIGVFVAAAWMLAAFGHRFDRLRMVPVALCVGALVGLGVGTYRQAGKWRDNETLFRHTLAVSRVFNEYAHYEVGVAMLARGDRTGARHHFEAILQVDPANGHGHAGMGTILAQEGNREAAVTHFESALRARPGDRDSRRSLGLLLADQGRGDEALVHLLEAARLDPADAMAHYRAGRILASRGELADATIHLRQAVSSAPADVPMRQGLVAILLQQGLVEEALPHMTELRGRANDDAQTLAKLGAAYGGIGLVQPALDAYGRSAQLQPGDVAVQVNLGVLLARSGRVAEAVGRFEVAARLQPGDPAIQFNLASALLARGQPADALRHYQTAIRARPEDTAMRLRAGSALVEAGQADMAGPLLAAAIEADSGSVEKVFEVVRGCARRQRLDEAAALVRELSSLAGRMSGDGKAGQAQDLRRRIAALSEELGLPGKAGSLPGGSSQSMGAGK